MPIGPGRAKIFIGGEWVESAGETDQQVVNPATGEVIAAVPNGTLEDVDRAVIAARRAFDSGWGRPPRESEGMPCFV